MPLVQCDYFFSSEFFKLMNEVENEDLVFTLETIVDKFGEEMAPYALGLCQNLVIFSFLFFKDILKLRMCFLENTLYLLGCCILEVYEHC